MGNQWCLAVPQLHLSTIPRWYKKNQFLAKSHKLHVFCDTREKVYSAVAYIKGESENGDIVTSFVASKSRVVPLKRLTTTRRLDGSSNESTVGKYPASATEDEKNK